MSFGLTPFSATQNKGVDTHDGVGHLPRTFIPCYYYLKLQCYYFQFPKKKQPPCWNSTSRFSFDLRVVKSIMYYTTSSKTPKCDLRSYDKASCYTNVTQQSTLSTPFTCIYRYCIFFFPTLGFFNWYTQYTENSETTSIGYRGIEIR